MKAAGPSIPDHGDGPGEDIASRSVGGLQGRHRDDYIPYEEPIAAKAVDISSRGKKGGLSTWRR